MENQEYKSQIFMKAVGITLSVLGVLGVIYFLASLGSSSDTLSQNFVTKYRQSAVRSRQVSELVNSTTMRIRRVNKLDKSGNTNEALDLIEITKKENNQAREKAKQVSVDLEKLADTALKAEESSEERKKQIRGAVDKEVELLGELVEYTERIDKFLQSLSLAIVSDEKQDRLAVAENLRAINSKYQEISELNNQFLAMVEQLGIFD